MKLKSADIKLWGLICRKINCEMKIGAWGQMGKINYGMDFCDQKIWKIKKFFLYFGRGAVETAIFTPFQIPINCRIYYRIAIKKTPISLWMPLILSVPVISKPRNALRRALSPRHIRGYPLRGFPRTTPRRSCPCPSPIYNSRCR